VRSLLVTMPALLEGAAFLEFTVANWPVVETPLAWTRGHGQAVAWFA
jgi:hypothetical protein